MITYTLLGNRPYEAITTRFTGAGRIHNAVKHADIPEAFRVDYATCNGIAGVMITYAFTDDRLVDMVSFAAAEEDDPKTRGETWFLGILTDKNGLNELSVHLPWNCTTYEIRMVVDAFASICGVQRSPIANKNDEDGDDSPLSAHF